jgi:hypothetical protein
VVEIKRPITHSEQDFKVHGNIVNSNVCCWCRKGVLDQVNGDEVRLLSCCRPDCGHYLHTREGCSGCKGGVTSDEYERGWICHCCKEEAENGAPGLWEAMKQDPRANEEELLRLIDQRTRQSKDNMALTTHDETAIHYGNESASLYEMKDRENNADEQPREEYPAFGGETSDSSLSEIEDDVESVSIDNEARDERIVGGVMGFNGVSNSYYSDEASEDSTTFLHQENLLGQTVDEDSDTTVYDKPREQPSPSSTHLHAQQLYTTNQHVKSKAKRQFAEDDDGNNNLDHDERMTPSNPRKKRTTKRNKGNLKHSTFKAMITINTRPRKNLLRRR